MRHHCHECGEPVPHIGWPRALRRVVSGISLIVPVCDECFLVDQIRKAQ